MRNSRTIIQTFIVLISSVMHSQSYVGHTIDNYAGIHGVAYNPSSIVDSNFRTDINLFSGSIFGGSDYFGINISDIISSDGGFDFEDDTEKFPSNENNFFFNADIVGPSFMFNLNKKSSIGFITRVRAFLNINNINGQLYETIVDDFETDDNFNFDSKNLNTNIHAWAEIGLAYGRILLDKEKHSLKGGATLKYLQGAGAAFMSSLGLQGDFNANTEILTTQGELNYGTTQDFDEDDVDFNNLTAGFGLDIGFTYQWHKETEKDTLHKTPYKLKVGLSITDIGSIKYKDTENTNYDLNNSVNTADFDEDIQDFLDENFNPITTTGSAKIKLPTALHLLVDYRVSKKWFISAQADLSMVKDNEELSNSVLNTITLAPRLETRWFSFYAPLSFRQYGDVSFGGGIRFGPLTVGSGSVFSNLISDSSKTTDVFLGLKIPVFRK